MEEYRSINIEACPVCCSDNLYNTIVTRDYYIPGFTKKEKINFLICRECAFIFQGNPMDPELIDYYYSNNNQPRNTNTNDIETLVHSKQANFISKVKNLNNKSLMEIGSSAGKFLNYLKENYQCDTYFDELNDIARKALEDNGHQHYKNNAGNFDVVVLRHVFEHIVNPYDYILSLKKFLDNDSVVFIEVPDWSYMDNCTDGITFEHVSHFNAAQLTRLLDRAGYNILRQEIDQTESYSTTPNRVLRVLAQKKPRAISAGVDKAFKAHADNSENRMFNSIKSILKDYPKDTQIGLYAASWMCQSILVDSDIVSEYKNIRIFDKDKKKQAKKFHGFQVEPQNSILMNSPKITFILSSYEYEIAKELRQLEYKGKLVLLSEIA